MHICRSLNSMSHLNCGFMLVSSLKILGITMADQFKCDTQASSLLKTASQRLYVIRCLKDSLSREELVRVYHAIITSVFLYASPVYGCLSSTLLSKLERFQRRAHRIVCGPTCDCNHFPPLSSKFEAAALQLLLRAETNNYHPLHELVPPRLPASNKLRMPACATSRRLNSFVPWSILLHNDLTSKI